MPARTSLGDSLTVKAAEFLGVCFSTLRDEDWAGELKPRRHPMNRYRRCQRTELEAVLRSVSREDPRVG